MTSLRRIPTSFLALSLILSLTLAACGMSPADKELSRMHKRLMSKITENARAFQQPLKSESAMNMHVTTSPIPGSFPGDLDATVKLTGRQDVSDKMNLLADMALDIAVLMEGPGGMLSGTPSPGKEQATVQTSAEARIAGRTASFMLKNVDVLAPGTPIGMFKLPEAMKGVWYGMTFDEINAEIKKKNAENPNEPPTPTIDELISESLSGQKFSPSSLIALYDNVHLWKGIELLPEKDGMVQIRVESDKEKIRKSVQAVIRYMNESAGPSWDSNLQKNPELKSLIDSLNSKDPKELKNIGSIKGIVSSDKKTAEFRGFDGDFFDATGKRLAHVSYLQTANGDITLDTNFEETKRTVSFTKKGESVRMEIDSKEVLTGTMSASKVDLTLKNDKTGAVELTVKFDIAASTREKADFHNIAITIPSKKLTIDAEKFSAAFSRDFKDFTMSLAAKGTLDKKPLFSVTMDAVRKEISNVAVTKPAFKPMAQLQQDFMSAMTGEQQPGADGLED